MNTINNYIRVGTQYFKIIEYPTTKDVVRRLQTWNLSNLRQDFEKDDITQIKKYDAFCNIPSHINYKRVYKNCYNQYEPLVHNPNQGEWKHTESFLRHIFEDQYELGLDYLTVLYREPQQCLPVLCLVSEERKTGKSTFIYFLKEIYGFNMTINSNEEFRARFNSDWIRKLIIGVEETLLDKIEDTERIKQMSTGKVAKEESKGIDKTEVEFFGKIILTSNNEKSFIKIDEHETRFWVRKIKSIQSENTHLLEDMKKEIPAFLHYLKHREISIKKTTRTWFPEEILYTDALGKLRKGNKTTLEKELYEIIMDELELYDLLEIEYTNKDLQNKMKEAGFRYSQSNIRETLEEKFHLKPSNSRSYYKYYYMGSGESQVLSKDSHKGRVYTFNKKHLENMGL